MDFLFRLKNAGSAPLEIEAVRPGCGCIVARYDREIAPGRVGTVSAVFDSASYRGPIEKSLLVSTNDPQAHAFLLRVRVDLQPRIEVLPGRDLQFLLQSGQEAEQIVTLRSSRLKRFQILKAETDVPYVQAVAAPELDDPPPGAGKELSRRTLRVRVLPTAPPSPFVASVTLSTDAEPGRPIVLRVTGEPDAPVRVIPPRLYFDAVPSKPKAPIDRELTLLVKEGSLQLLSAETDDPLLRLEVVNGRGGRVPGVRVWYLGGWKAGPVNGTIVLKTSNPTRPRLVVPYTAEVTP